MNVNEIELPSYMTSLPQSIVEELSIVEEERVIACGVDPRDGSLVFVTNHATVRSIVPNGQLVPSAASPTLDGRGMYLKLQGSDAVFPVSVHVAIDLGKQCVEGGELFVNDRFVCNVDLSSDT